MDDFEDCQIVGCEARACVAWSTVHPGVDYDGSDALFQIDRMQCASGHWYTRTGEGVRDPQLDPMTEFEDDYANVYSDGMPEDYFQ